MAATEDSTLEPEANCDKVEGTMQGNELSRLNAESSSSIAPAITQTRQRLRMHVTNIKDTWLRSKCTRMAVTVLACVAAGALFLAPTRAQAPPQTPAPPNFPHGGPHDDHPHGPEIFRPNIHPPKGTVPKPGESVVFDASSLGSPIKLEHNWRLGIAPGLDPAQPAFDDSNWPVRDAKEALAEVDDSAADDDEKPPPDRQHDHDDPDHSHPHPPHGRPFAWFRIHIQLPEKHGPLVVMVNVPVSRSAQVSFNGAVGMELFVDGKRVTPDGPKENEPETYLQISRIYPIEIPTGERTLTLAVRIPFSRFGLDAYTGFFAHRTFFLGESSDLRSHLDLWQHAMLFERLPALINAGLKLLLALFLIALFFTQKDRPEYLWLALHLLVVAPMAYVGMVGSMGRIGQLWLGAMVIQCLLIGACFYLEFLVAFLSLRKRWYIRALRWTAPLLLTLGPLLLFAQEGKAFAIGLFISALFAILWVLTWLLFVGLTLTIAAFKRNYEAALLLLPLLLSVVGLGELASTAGSSSWLGAPMQSPLTFRAGPIPIHFSDFADFVGIFVIILIIFVRFERIHRERERASNELAAARSVQELMIPREAPKTPGFQVETIYTPATEVGGDFFHIQATGDGGLLVVIGDVAGHGLQAAMNVSMLMGALRRSPQIEPAQLLAGLNQVLFGSSSLTTCEAAYFSATGEVVIASAGHPPPFLNSQEITLPGGLPLGVIPDVEYEEVRLYLHPGDRLLMMSDGVVEARRPNGELFGFDRVRNLSNQSAFFIADAAKDFGQEDDITVLTVRRLAPAAAVAA